MHLITTLFYIVLIIFAVVVASVAYFGGRRLATSFFVCCMINGGIYVGLFFLSSFMLYHFWALILEIINQPPHGTFTTVFRPETERFTGCIAGPGYITYIAIRRKLKKAR